MVIAAPRSFAGSRNDLKRRKAKRCKAKNPAEATFHFFALHFFAFPVGVDSVLRRLSTKHTKYTKRKRGITQRRKDAKNQNERGTGLGSFASLRLCVKPKTSRI